MASILGSSRVTPRSATDPRNWSSKSLALPTLPVVSSVRTSRAVRTNSISGVPLARSSSAMPMVKALT